MTIDSAAQEVLWFWFGEVTADGMPADDRNQFWFRKNSEQDEEIRQRFGALVGQALAGALEHWTTTPEGRIALVLLLDQFTRNIHRDTPDAFAGDSRALQHTLAALEAGEDRQLPPIHRVFLYMPLEHAEDEVQQERAVACFRALAAEAPSGHEAAFRNYAAYAEAHRDVIHRFGRFPHRNAQLGRTSTPEEVRYLAEPGAGF